MKHKVEKILEGLTTSQRNLVIVKLLFHLAGYRIRHIRRRARVHWLGSPRPRRPERALIPMLYFSGMVFLSPYSFAVWSMYIGGMISIFLILYTAYRFIPVKRYHYIGRK